ncbi:MAG: hypothetical protein COB50_02665 [Thiotrichales bacterium]|nr:MAG: hypothetical protein COB50_02665 [Thiotrichales bacterium]
MQHILVSIIGSKDVKFTGEFSRLCVKYTCDVQEMYMSHMAQDSVMVTKVSGSWSDLAKLEEVLIQFAKMHELKIVVKRTQAANHETQYMPYTISMTALYANNLLSEVLSFFDEQSVVVRHVSTEQYCNKRSNSNMFALTLSLLVPVGTTFTHFRDGLLVMCDELGLDVMFEPVRD